MNIESQSNQRFQFPLWRLLGLVLLVSLALGCLRLANDVIREYGPGSFPTLLIVVSLLLLAGAAGILFRRARLLAGTMLYIVLRVVSIVLGG